MNLYPPFTTAHIKDLIESERGRASARSDVAAKLVQDSYNAVGHGYGSDLLDPNTSTAIGKIAPVSTSENDRLKWDISASTHPAFRERNLENLITLAESAYVEDRLFAVRHADLPASMVYMMVGDPDTGVREEVAIRLEWENTNSLDGYDT